MWDIKNLDSVRWEELHMPLTLLFDKIDKGYYWIERPSSIGSISDDHVRYRVTNVITGVLTMTPLPKLIGFERPNGTFIIVYPYSRIIETLYEFAHGGLILDHPNPDINNKRWSDISPKLQNRLLGANVDLMVLYHDMHREEWDKNQLVSIAYAMTWGA